MPSSHRQDAQNAFDRAEPYIMLVIGLVFVICGLVSGYATFSGIRIFLEEVGASGLLVNGTAILLTIATVAIITVGWSLITRFGPEARTPSMRGCMVGLGAFMLIITLAISSLSNLMALVGPAAKVHDWRISYAEQTAFLNTLEQRARGVTKLLPAWRAEAEKACPAAHQELERGTISATGRGAGPVAFALGGVCSQTRSFVASMETALAATDAAVADGRLALVAMRQATRNRSDAVILREDAFLEAGEALIAAFQAIKAADLSDVLDAGAVQVRSSVAKLSDESAFSSKQVETVRAIREGVEGLIKGTDLVMQRLQADPLPEIRAITSPDYIAAVLTHAERFVPVFAAAIGIDVFACQTALKRDPLSASKKAPPWERISRSPDRSRAVGEGAVRAASAIC